MTPMWLSGYNNHSMDNTLYIAFILAASAFTGLIVWLIAASRSKAAFSADLAEARHRAATAEGTTAELRIQINTANEDLNKLRSMLDVEREAKVRAETQLQETLQRLNEERKIFDEAGSKLTDTFKALAGDTLDNTNRAFMSLAKETFDKVLADSRGDLGKRQEAIDGLVRPLVDSLKRFEEHVAGIEKSRHGAYTSLEEQLKVLTESNSKLRKETGNLVTALRLPQVRGRWGEMTLKRVAELAGMSEHCDFTEQVTVDSDTVRIRPDMVVHLPAGREIVVDSKVPLEAYLKVLSAESEEQRKRYLADHAGQLRKHMNNLGEKAYWRLFKETPEFVVMFIPGESFFAAAVDQDHSLIEDGMKKRVIIATPTTFIALLHAVAYGWRQEQVAKNAQQISELGKQLYERMRVLSEHMVETGKGLEKAGTAYNKAVGSLETRVFPAARKFKELGAAAGSDIAVVEPVETMFRTLDPDIRED